MKNVRNTRNFLIDDRFPIISQFFGMTSNILLFSSFYRRVSSSPCIHFSPVKFSLFTEKLIDLRLILKIDRQGDKQNKTEGKWSAPIGGSGGLQETKKVYFLREIH